MAACCVACAGPSTNIPGVTSDEVASERRKQQVAQIQTYFSQLARLQNVAYRLTHANRADCKEDVAPRLGFTSITPNELPGKYKELAIEALGLSEGTSTITSVAEGSPAAKAGIRQGDELVSLDGEPVPSTEASVWIATFMKRSDGKSVNVELRRNNQSLSRTVPTVMTCSVPILLMPDEQTNAFTDGKRIVIFSGIMRVAQTDAELATVVGHELAHVTMGHLKKREQNKIAGAVGGAVLDVGLAMVGVYTGGAFTRGLGDVGGRAYATDFEREADYVGTYYVARAGYDPSTAERFWRSLAQENPKQIFYAGLHPTSPERFLLMQKTNEEIADKKKRRAPLIPEPKPAATEATPVAASSPN